MHSLHGQASAAAEAAAPWLCRSERDPCMCCLSLSGLRNFPFDWQSLPIDFTMPAEKAGQRGCLSPCERFGFQEFKVFELLVV